MENKSEVRRYLKTKGQEIPLQGRPLIMGILNITEDSFSGDGLMNPSLALARIREMVTQGADIVDVGGESARTNRGPISEEEEIRRILSIVEGFDAAVGEAKPLLSINTWRPRVAQAILARGGDILNDIGGLPTPQNAQICAEFGTALVIMHSVGEPKVSHRHIRYAHIIDSLKGFFAEKIRLAQQAGVDQRSIILDPGIDFAKQEKDNLTIYRELGILQESFGLPLLLPVSRKHVIGSVLQIAEPNRRDAGTMACIVAGFLRGAKIFRVHNVRAAVRTIKILHGVISMSP